MGNKLIESRHGVAWRGMAWLLEAKLNNKDETRAAPVDTKLGAKQCKGRWCVWRNRLASGPQECQFSASTFVAAVHYLVLVGARPN